MKVRIKNLGPLKQADFSLADLTIICGKNNSGKTYATYALFGFLEMWRKLIHIDVSDSSINKLLQDGVAYIDLQRYVDDAPSILAEAAKSYSKQLSKVFSANEAYFSNAAFSICMDSDIGLTLDKEFNQTMGSKEIEIFSLSKAEGKSSLVISLLAEQATIPHEVIKRVIRDAISEIVFSQLFPIPFIASAERTGAAIFRKELNFARNRLLDEISKSEKNINPMELLFNNKQDYALPVEKDVDFTRQLEGISKRSSFIEKNHPELLKTFSHMIGGEYSVTDNDELYFTPSSNKRVKLTMDESSSAVRSLLGIGFYLKHTAKPNDILIIDEPELNLHPENQRHIARLIAQLINVGIKVFITTHSDYIIKELNTLIMLNHDSPYIKKIMQEEGYLESELLKSESIKVYIAEKALVKVEGKTRRIRHQTLIPAKVTSEMGIDAPSFDTAINDMNRIQEAIVWGEEE